jgi:hypothetical protein
MTTNEKPASQLATLVVDRLIKDGLLRPEKRDQLIAKVAAGEMKDEDWNLEIDLSSREAAEK